MPIKEYKSTTPDRHGMTSLSYREITTDKSEKGLLQPLKSKGGRDNNGRTTTRHQGGGYKRIYRAIGFEGNKGGIPARAATIEYDPNHPINIALLNYVDGGKRYIITPEGLTVGMNIISGGGADIKAGNIMELKDIPEGTFVHNIELGPGKGEQLARSTGASAQIPGVEEKYTTVRLASGEVHRTLSSYRAAIGQVGNEGHSPINHGKAGCMRWEGVRPTVRGFAINPDDHPHGGGERHTSVGRKPPMTPWDKKTIGTKTRKAKKALTKLIIRRHNGR